MYGYHYLSLPEHADTRKEITDAIQSKAIELILPMVGSVVQDLTRNTVAPGQMPDSFIPSTTDNGRNVPADAILPSDITPEMIKAVQDAMRKK